MASGIHKLHHQQPGAGCNGSSSTAHHHHQCSSPEEGEQELQLKMCKKIAQLTKVIYALNTKNDEHEASIQALEEAHQEEIQHILAETKEAALRYKNKVEEEQALRKHIQTLEETLEKYRRLKEEAPPEFAACKKQVEARELGSETQQADERIEFPKEMLRVKPDFENRVQTSNQEVDGLVNERWAFEGEELDHKGKLGDPYSTEMQDTLCETANLQRENQKLAKYAEQASQLQAFHEREKETWKKVMQQAVAEACREWQQREAEQRRSQEAHEAASRQQMKKLEADLEVKGQRIGELRKHSQKLKEKMQDLEIQLKEAQQVNTACKNLVKTLEEELVIAKERLLLQENEILHKTEAMEMALDSKTKAGNEVDEMKNQILQQAFSTKQSQGDQNGGDSQPQETAGSEKDTVQQQHQEELRKLKHESEEEKMRLKEQLVKGLEDLVKKHSLEIKSVQASMDVERQKLQKEVQTQLEELKKKYENEIIQLQKQNEAVNGKLQDCSLEILRLENFIRQNRDIPKFAEFLKSHTRKTHGRQQESQNVFVQQKDIAKQPEERAKCREQPLGTRNEEKSRLASGGAPKREDRQTLASFQKEKGKEIQALQEEWYYQKTELQAQVTQLKETLEQQANAFREALQQQSLESGKEKEKLLQELQDTIKESQDMKAQLEASHQRTINLLEKSKNQELKETEEHWKKEYNDRFKEQQQSHSLEMQTLEEKAREELQSKLERMQKQQALLIESLRMELSEQRVSCVTHKKEKEELQVELKNMMATERQQEGSYQNQIKSLKDELEKYKNEILGLKKENSLLKDTMDLLSVDVELQKQTSAQLQDKQHRRLKELDEKPRKREEDYLIGCLQDKLNEKELIKELMDGRKLQHSLMSSSEPRRNRSFSFNTNPSTCLTPIAKQKKKMDEAPSRIVSVPNLASYARSFLSGDLRPKRNPPQITKSTSLDQNPGCVRVCYPSVQAVESKPVPRLQSNETSAPKDAQKQDPRHQEWFTKYFSF
ncbi:protein FAM184B [Tiliqua scincoides]|uniref:protein FAM184B n=1 Tax=Tiliqua scincoides TaxID=71010 RepID=UPI0034626D8E